MNTTRALTLFLALALAGFVLLALSTPAVRAAPVILRVTTAGATAWPCGTETNWSNACALQTALTRSVSPSELWVAAGTYKPTTGTDRTATFQLRDGIALYGGFAGSETARDQRDLTEHVTILSGDIGTPGNSSDNSYHVVTGSWTNSSAVLDGFTVTGGNANVSFMFNDHGGGMNNDGGSPTVANVTFISNTASTSGGGMFNDNGSSPTLTNVTFSGNSATLSGGGMINDDVSSPTLANVTFISNTASSSGGGMCNYWNSSPTISNAIFWGNTATNGGGMYSESYSDPTLTNITFVGNTGTAGGGMYDYYYSSPVLSNVTFANNTASKWGGGIYNYSSIPTLTNVTISGNSATLSGGGMYDYFYSSPTLTNVTISGNSATLSGGGVSNYEFSSPAIRNAILWDNTATNGTQIYNDAGQFSSKPSLYDNVVQEGCPAGSSTCIHIITADPRLGPLGNWGGSTETVPLLPGSSAIDAGDDTHCPATDQRGFPRPHGPHCDIGTYESQGFVLIHLPLLSR